MLELLRFMLTGADSDDVTSVREEEKEVNWSIYDAMGVRSPTDSTAKRHVDRDREITIEREKEKESDKEEKEREREKEKEGEGVLEESLECWKNIPEKEAYPVSSPSGEGGSKSLDQIEFSLSSLLPGVTLDSIGISTTLLSRPPRPPSISLDSPNGEGEGIREEGDREGEGEGKGGDVEGREQESEGKDSDICNMMLSHTNADPNVNLSAFNCAMNAMFDSFSSPAATKRHAVRLEDINFLKSVSLLHSAYLAPSPAPSSNPLARSSPLSSLPSSTPTSPSVPVSSSTETDPSTSSSSSTLSKRTYLKYDGNFVDNGSPQVSLASFNLSDYQTLSPPPSIQPPLSRHLTPASADSLPPTPAPSAMSSRKSPKPVLRSKGKKRSDSPSTKVGTGENSKEEREREGLVIG